MVWINFDIKINILIIPESRIFNLNAPIFKMPSMFRIRPHAVSVVFAYTKMYTKGKECIITKICNIEEAR